MGQPEHGSQGFYSLLRLYAIKVLQISKISKITFCQFDIIFLHCPCDLSVKYFEAHSFTVSTTGVIISLVFLLPWFFQYFFYVLNKTLFIRISSPLYHSFIHRWFLPPSFDFFSFLFCHQKSKNFVCSAKEKSRMKHMVYETTKVNIPNLLSG